MTAPTRPPSILDVAAAAGVSKSLVSYALRGEGGVSDVTRERILAVARELGYRPNALARGLVQGRTRQLGVVMTDIRNPYHADVALGVDAAAGESDLGVLLVHGRRDPQRLATQVRAMLMLAVDGLVVSSSRVPFEALAEAARARPVVVVGRPPQVPDGVDTLANEDAAGIGAAVEHLVGLGHRDIAFLTSSEQPTALAREAGYLSALARHGLAARAEVRRCDPDGLADAAARLVAGTCTAVVTNNDLSALAVVDAADAAGRRVPHDLSVVGYDDTVLASTVRPRLTSVDQHGDALGRLAVAMLAERLAGRTAPRREVLVPQLRVRDSTGRAPARP